MNRYRRMKGPMGDRLRASIQLDGPSASFILTEDDRCPLLNADGLCDLILAKGERALCQICRDHPRFRFSVKGREEIGLGLCCEEACRIILGWKEPVRLYLEDDGRSKAEMGRSDSENIARRDRLIALAQERGLPMVERMRQMLAMEGVCLPDLEPAQWIPLLLKLERLDDAWTMLLEKCLAGYPHAPIDEIIQEQLLVYFIYRHCAAEWKSHDFALGALPFCVLSVRLITWLCHAPEDIYETARMYSAEIEYSQENLDFLLELLDRYNRGENI